MPQTGANHLNAPIFLPRLLCAPNPTRSEPKISKIPASTRYDTQHIFAHQPDLRELSALTLFRRVVHREHCLTPLNTSRHTACSACRTFGHYRARLRAVSRALNLSNFPPLPCLCRRSRRWTPVNTCQHTKGSSHLSPFTFSRF